MNNSTNNKKRSQCRIPPQQKRQQAASPIPPEDDGTAEPSPKDKDQSPQQLPRIAPFRDKYYNSYRFPNDEAGPSSSRRPPQTDTLSTRQRMPTNNHIPGQLQSERVNSEILNGFQQPPPPEFVTYITLPHFGKENKENKGNNTNTKGGGTGSGAGGSMGNQGIRQHVETSQKTGVFHLSKAKLSEFPPELAKLVSVLRNLDLSDNRIPSIPQNISAFVNLKHLNLNSNQIEIIPDQIGQLTKLETLSLANNRIKSIPATIAQLQKLRDANLSSNALTAFPLVFTSLRFLTCLDLSKNRIPDVPDGCGGLQVVELILNQNQVRELSKDLALCPNLKTLRVQENTLELTGIPMQLLMDSQVSLLSLEGNLFDVKHLSDLDGYDQYMERYTSTKKKLT